MSTINDFVGILDRVLQKIIDDDTTPAPGEEHLASLTAGDRVPWAKARAEFFAKGKNKASLDAVEKVLNYSTSNILHLAIIRDIPNFKQIENRY